MERILFRKAASRSSLGRTPALTMLRISLLETVAGVSLRTGVHLVRETSRCLLYRLRMDRLSTRRVRVILRSLAPIIHSIVAHDSDPATPDAFWQLNGVLEIFCRRGVSPVDQ